MRLHFDSAFSLLQNIKWLIQRYIEYEKVVKTVFFIIAKEWTQPIGCS